MADKTSDGGMTNSKAARGQTIVRAYGIDTSSGNSGLEGAGKRFSTPGDAEISMKNVGISRQLQGASAAGAISGRKDTTA